MTTFVAAIPIARQCADGAGSVEKSWGSVGSRTRPGDEGADASSRCSTPVALVIGAVTPGKGEQPRQSFPAVRRSALFGVSQEFFGVPQALPDSRGHAVLTLCVRRRRVLGVGQRLVFAGRLRRLCCEGSGCRLRGRPWRYGKPAQAASKSLDSRSHAVLTLCVRRRRVLGVGQRLVFAGRLRRLCCERSGRRLRGRPWRYGKPAQAVSKSLPEDRDQRG